MAARFRDSRARSCCLWQEPFHRSGTRNDREKGESSAIPFVVMTVLVFAVAAAILYFAIEPRNVLSLPEAVQLVTKSLDAEGASTVRFHTGLIKDRPGESPRDARYRLLEEAGVLEIARPAASRTSVLLTQRGGEILSAIAGVKRSKDADGNESYLVPLAIRKLIDITNISMEGPEHASIEYTWQWQPNALGESFDRLGPAMTMMSAEDQLVLVSKFAARYYHAVPKKETIRVVKRGKGWQVTPP
ncbi:MAG: hypothetical protein JO356_18520 [Acidobacteria bacterium]|nr:hypothetical protein [Acidobacteriota bacterium]